MTYIVAYAINQVRPIYIPANTRSHENYCLLLAKEQPVRQGSVYVSLPDSGKQHHAFVHITDVAQQDVLWQAMQSSQGPGLLAGTVS